MKLRQCCSIDQDNFHVSSILTFFYMCHVFYGILSLYNRIIIDLISLSKFADVLERSGFQYFQSCSTNLKHSKLGLGDDLSLS